MVMHNLRSVSYFKGIISKHCYLGVRRPGPVRPRPRPQKNVLLQKKLGQSHWNYAGNRKKPTNYWLSSQV